MKIYELNKIKLQTLETKKCFGCLADDFATSFGLKTTKKMTIDIKVKTRNNYNLKYGEKKMHKLI